MADTFELVSERQARRGAQQLWLHLQRDVAAAAQLLDSTGMDVETHRVVLLAEFNRERQAHIPQPDDPYARPFQCEACFNTQGISVVVTAWRPPGSRAL